MKQAADARNVFEGRDGFALAENAWDLAEAAN